MAVYNQVIVRKASHKELTNIYNLLEELNLPIDGISDHLSNFFVALEDEIVVGVIGMEIYGEIGLLRSVGVKSSHQGLKIGATLVSTIEKHAKINSIKNIYLFTDTAERWFERYGYTKIPLEKLDPILEKSEEFTLCKDSVRMIKTLNVSGVRQ